MVGRAATFAAAGIAGLAAMCVATGIVGRAATFAAAGIAGLAAMCAATGIVGRAAGVVFAAGIVG